MTGSEEDRLGRENEELRRQLQQRSELHDGPPAKLWRPSGITISALLLAALAAIIVAFFAGYIPLQKRNTLIAAEIREHEDALPRVEVVELKRSPDRAELELPGSIQPVTEAPIMARSDGYILRRLADIGDHVKTGQPLAEMEAPEMQEQIRQAQANVQQANAAVDQAVANRDRGKADAELARASAERFARLAAQGVISREEDDRYKAQYQALAAGLQALEKAIAVQRSNVAAAEANLARLEKLQGYHIVKAPFDGVITQRLVDVGALVNAGQTLLYRIAQTGTLRTYINVPQMHASSVRTGQSARLSVSNFPGRQFSGSVARTANALDPASRTLLVEVHVPNPNGALLPGMYAQVDLMSSRSNSPLLVPGDALIVRASGTSVAVVLGNHTVHLQKVEVGRDYGDRIEVVSGLKAGDVIIPNPGDLAREGLKVEPLRTEKH